MKLVTCSVRYLLAMVIGAGSLLSCSSSSSVPDPAAAVSVQDPGLHAIMTQNIERHLARIDAGSREDVIGVIQSAQSLQLSADVIVTMRNSLGLRADAITVFVQRAGELKGFAGELETLARAGQLAELRAVTDQINGSCAGCHTLFRSQ